MFFYLSKILWFFAAPSNLMVVATALALLALYAGFQRIARCVLLAVVVLAIFFGLGPGGQILLSPLENRFPQLPDDFPAPTGFIVLGGGVDEVVSTARGSSELSDAGTRMTASAALAYRYPNARIVFSGGSGRILGGDVSEAEVARRIYTSLGIAADRMTLEEESRNTWENAVFTRDLVKPKPGEVWLLVTSAYHMPRSMGLFRQAGFPVVPCPVDYSTRGTWYDFIRPSAETSLGLRRTDRAVREYIGLVAYYLSGKTDALFPKP
ncbi:MULTISPECIES: YdcF family protein [unclassified Beijerinckia]|uniref:YdcF family protein n=1 Tax=unclassified Beijerinckia TaxID=2638183 RepID=UPI000895CB5F|nr:MULTISPECIES: YdcF family protein [unclassified Beijerinckia]MDH7794486.1 uncharacterized SAM-binding protein YcdF (DUF218 family) [Beijerinckia sp. GAS462]SEB64008.1 Uncharacterized SAM-binding protein YcdF, DUF218 family [Beijerinckia sp. 28-YEA-48]